MESTDLRKRGLKVTHPRIRVLALLEATSPRHMTAEDIYRKLADDGDEIGLATVYRVLTQFEAAGLVRIDKRDIHILDAKRLSTYPRPAE